MANVLAMTIITTEMLTITIDKAYNLDQTFYPMYIVPAFILPFLIQQNNPNPH
jgi:hypothetical protein